MTRFKKVAVAALIAGFLAAFIPLAASTYKQHSLATKLGPMDTHQMMLDAKDLPVVEVADPV
jgi:hypothetical protein